MGPKATSSHHITRPVDWGDARLADNRCIVLHLCILSYIWVLYSTRGNAATTALIGSVSACQLLGTIAMSFTWTEPFLNFALKVTIVRARAIRLPLREARGYRAMHGGGCGQRSPLSRRNFTFLLRSLPPTPTAKGKSVGIPSELSLAMGQTLRVWRE